MIIIKYIFLILIFLGSSFIGYLFSKKYKNRVAELRELKNVTNILETKIKFTYEPLGEIFNEILSMTEKGISKIFKQACINLETEDVKTSWENAIDSSKQYLNLNKEDINIIKGLGKMLR